MTSRVLAIITVVLVVGVLLVGGALFAEDNQSADQAIPQGFTREYLVIETTSGTFTVLRRPQLRSLGTRAYVVGSTVTLEKVTDDELFKPTDQWVCLEEVRRMGEAASDRDLMEIRQIAEERSIRDRELRLREEQLARRGR